MENLTFWELGALIIGGLLAFAGAVNALVPAAERLAKVCKLIKAPNDTQNDRLDALEEWKAGADKKLANDKERLDAIEKGNRASQRALLALLDHGLNGNNIKQMEDAKEELKNHLINR